MVVGLPLGRGGQLANVPPPFFLMSDKMVIGMALGGLTCLKSYTIYIYTVEW